MNKNTTSNFFSLRNLNEKCHISRRTSLSGFAYPEELSRFPTQFPTIPEAKHPSTIPANAYHATNGYYQKKSEITSQNFFSENNVNLINGNQHRDMMFSALSPRYYYNETTNIPKFSSSPYIAQSSLEHLHNQSNFKDLRIEYNYPFQPNSHYHNLNNMYNTPHNGNSQEYANENSVPYPQYVLYDPHTNSYQNVVIYSHNSTAIQSSLEIDKGTERCHNIHTNESSNCDYGTLIDLSSEKEPTRNELSCQLNMVQQNVEPDILSDFVKDDLMYFLPSELSNSVTDNNCTESQSMPSLHGDQSAYSEFDTSEDDRINTVHGEQMLQQLQKLTSVFTNVVNLPKLDDNDAIGSSQSNLSRFKKTRIKEWTRFWRMERFLIQDNMVKIIPEKILKIKSLTLDQLDKVELDMFKCQFPKQAETFQIYSEPPGCAHSTFKYRYSKHSSRRNHKYRSSFKAHSPINLCYSVNKQMPSNVSSRQSHRKSLQIPLKMPMVCNPMISLPSSSISHCRGTFVKPPNNCQIKSSKLKRRWSVCGTKLEKNFDTQRLQSQSVHQSGDLMQLTTEDAITYDFNREQSFDILEQSEISPDCTTPIWSNFESKLDKQLADMKKTVMSYVESSVSEYNNEILSLQNSQANLQKELNFYKDKVKTLEDSVRENVPKDQWERCGIVVSEQ